MASQLLVDEGDLRAVAASSPQGRRTLLLVEKAGRVVGTHSLDSDQQLQKTASSWAASAVLNGRPPPALKFTEGARTFSVGSHGQVNHQGAAYLLVEISSEGCVGSLATAAGIDAAPRHWARLPGVDGVDQGPSATADGADSSGVDSPCATSPNSRGVRRRRRGAGAGAFGAELHPNGEDRFDSSRQRTGDRSFVECSSPAARVLLQPDSQLPSSHCGQTPQIEQYLHQELPHHLLPVPHLAPPAPSSASSSAQQPLEQRLATPLTYHHVPQPQSQLQYSQHPQAYWACSSSPYAASPTGLVADHLGGPSQLQSHPFPAHTTQAAAQAASAAQPMQPIYANLLPQFRAAPAMAHAGPAAPRMTAPSAGPLPPAFHFHASHVTAAAALLPASHGHAGTSASGRGALTEGRGKAGGAGLAENVVWDVYKTGSTAYFMEAGDPNPVLIVPRPGAGASPCPPAPPPGTAVALGIVCMTKQPHDFATWLHYHHTRVGVERFYIKVEDTPELKALLDTPPWDRVVHATFDDGTQRDYFAQMDRQSSHISASLPLARAAGLTHLLHIDDDELLYCASGWQRLRAELASAPVDRPDCHLCNVEALLPSAQCASPFREAVVFRHLPTRYTSYTNGKSIGRLDAATLRAHGPHHFRTNNHTGGKASAITHHIPADVAVVLHYESATYSKWHAKYMDLAARHGNDPNVFQRVPFAFYRKSIAAAAAMLNATDAATKSEAAASAYRLWCEYKLAPAGLPPVSAQPRRLPDGLTLLSPFAQPGRDTAPPVEELSLEELS